MDSPRIAQNIPKVGIEIEFLQKVKAHSYHVINSFKKF